MHMDNQIILLGVHAKIQIGKSRNIVLHSETKLREEFSIRDAEAILSSPSR
jgi:hypothetical protein